MKRDNLTARSCQQDKAQPVGPRYSIIPGHAPYDTRLKDFDVRVLACIGRHTSAQGWCNLNQGKMATLLGKTRRAVNGSVSNLTKFGYITKQDLRSLEHGAKRQNICVYRVIMDAAPPPSFTSQWTEGDTSDLENVASQGGEVGNVASQGVGNVGLQGLRTQGYNTTTPILTTPINNEKQYPSLRSGERAHAIEAKFDVIEGKGKAVAVVETAPAKAIRVPGKTSRKEHLHPLPDDWALTDDLQAYAGKKGYAPAQIEDMFEGFRLHYLSNQKPFARWDMVWQKWVRNQSSYEKQPATVSRNAKQEANPERFSGFKVVEVHGCTISGEDANSLLDSIPGSTYAMVRKSLVDASGEGISTFTKAGGKEDKFSKAALKAVLDWCSKDIRWTLAIAKHGNAEKLAGGPVGFVQCHGEKTAVEYGRFVLSQSFIDKLQADYPDAWMTGISDTSGKWGRPITTGGESFMPEFQREVYRNATAPENYPDRQGEIEAAMIVWADRMQKQVQDVLANNARAEIEAAALKEEQAKRHAERIEEEAEYCGVRWCPTGQKRLLITPKLNVWLEQFHSEPIPSELLAKAVSLQESFLSLDATPCDIASKILAHVGRYMTKAVAA